MVARGEGQGASVGGGDAVGGCQADPEPPVLRVRALSRRKRLQAPLGDLAPPPRSGAAEGRRARGLHDPSGRLIRQRRRPAQTGTPTRPTLASPVKETPPMPLRVQILMYDGVGEQDAIGAP